MLPPAVSELVVPTVIAPGCPPPPPAVEDRISAALASQLLVSVPLLVVSVVPVEPPTVSTPATAFRSPEPVAVIDALRSRECTRVNFSHSQITEPTICLVSRPRLMLPPAVSELVVPTVIAPVCATPPPAVDSRLYTLSLPDALPILPLLVVSVVPVEPPTVSTPATAFRSPEPVAVIDAL